MAVHVPIGEPANDAEVWAFDYLKENLSDRYTIITNVDVYSESGQPFECDAIIVGEWAVYVVDVKGYQGQLSASKDVWRHSSRTVANPLPKLNQNARVLAGRCKNRTGYNQHAPWCQAMVFVTGGIGGEIKVDTNGYDLPVYTPATVINALTHSNYITSHVPRRLEQYQSKMALEAICDFELLKNQSSIVASFKKLTKLSVKSDVELWEVKPQGHSFDYRYWMKYVDITGLSTSAVKGMRDRFNKEYYVLNALGDIPSVPIVLNYHDDGECLALVHQAIEGLCVTEINDEQQLISILKNIALALLSMQKKGVYHRALKLSNIYVTEEGELQLLDVGLARADGAQTIASAAQLENPWLAPEYIETEAYTEASSVFLLAATFLPLYAELLPQSNNTLDLMNEDYDFVAKNFIAHNKELVAWFKSALSIEPENRPTLSELIDSVDEVQGANSGNGLPIVIEPGSLVNEKYELLECIGRGGTSSVWKAKHLIGEYDCCLKILDEFEGADDIAKKEFETLRMLYHPNILRIFDLDVIPSSDTYFLTCEFIDGENLDEVDTSADEFLNYFRQILTALQYLHRINKVHKDIKPANIMVRDGKAFLIDFNISSLDNRLLGTISYKDPLVKAGGWTPFSDVYSLVLTFSEMIMKTHPFHENDEIPLSDNEFKYPVKTNIPSPLMSKFSQVLNHEVKWEGIQDYQAWFGLAEKVEIVIPDEILKEWNINSGYMTKVLTTMLSDMQARSKNVVINNTLKYYGIVGNKVNRGSISSAISALKGEKVVNYTGSKVALDKEFLSVFLNK